MQLTCFLSFPSVTPSFWTILFKCDRRLILNAYRFFVKNNGLTESLKVSYLNVALVTRYPKISKETKF